MLIFVMCFLCALILGVCGGNWFLAALIFLLGLATPILTVAVKIIFAIVDLISTVVSNFWRVDECD